MRAARVVAAVCLLLLTACTVSEPDGGEWRDLARQTLDDVASEVATARVTLTQLEEDRLPAAYGETLLAEAEKAAGKAEEGLSSVQPPSRLATTADRVLALIAKAVAAVQSARETAVAGAYDVPRLVDRLQRLQTALDARRARL